MTRRTVISAWILGGLLSAVFLTVLITPTVEKGTPASSYSPGTNGVRLAHDLIGRLGWKPERREVPFSDTLHDPAPTAGHCWLGCRLPPPPSHRRTPYERSHNRATRSANVAPVEPRSVAG